MVSFHIPGPLIAWFFYSHFASDFMQIFPFTSSYPKYIAWRFKHFCNSEKRCLISRFKGRVQMVFEIYLVLLILFSCIHSRMANAEVSPKVRNSGPKVEFCRHVLLAVPLRKPWGLCFWVIVFPKRGSIALVHRISKYPDMKVRNTGGTLVEFWFTPAEVIFVSLLCSDSYLGKMPLHCSFNLVKNTEKLYKAHI